MSAEDTSANAGAQITFNVKSSSDEKFSVTVPESMTVAALKEKLSTSEYADTPAARQRLIYSGRVMKDLDPISTYKVKEGNTIHMVKSAASAVRQTPASQASATSGNSSTTNPAAAGVPQNLAAGTGNDPLSGLTGARYAGFAQLPGASMFGADGGMGAPPGPEDLLRMMENPMFLQQMNEAMNNPSVIEMMQNNPVVRNDPLLQNILNNTEMRRLLMDPTFLRQSMQMHRAFSRGGTGGAESPSMPAPGMTDTTPEQQQQQQQQGGGATSPSSNNTTNNPFNAFNFPPGQNLFSIISGQAPSNNTTTPSTTTNNNSSSNTSTTADSTSNSDSTQTSNAQQPSTQSPAPNPLASMFGNMGNVGVGDQQNNPFAATQQLFRNNPEMARRIMEQFFSTGNNPGAATGTGDAAGVGLNFNQLANMLGGSGAPSAPADTRPPEEQYAGELRQLNDMGFHEFERNVRALRMAGGSVQGAIEYLLNGSLD